MSEIKPRMVSGEAVCHEGCPTFQGGFRLCRITQCQTKECWPYYRAALAESQAERERLRDENKAIYLKTDVARNKWRVRAKSAESERDHWRGVVEKMAGEIARRRTRNSCGIGFGWSVSGVLNEYLDGSGEGEL